MEKVQLNKENNQKFDAREGIIGESEVSFQRAQKEHRRKSFSGVRESVSQNSKMKIRM